jgi:hypothetical protein
MLLQPARKAAVMPNRTTRIHPISADVRHSVGSLSGLQGRSSPPASGRDCTYLLRLARACAEYEPQVFPVAVEYPCAV